MVARLRAPNVAAWLSGPQHGLAALNEAGQNLGRSIATGLTNLDSGIAEQRQEKESRRRFDIEKGFEGRRLDIAEYDAALRGERVDMEREDRAEKAAAADSLLDDIGNLSTKFTTMSQLGMQPSDEEWQRFNSGVQALGGQQQVQAALQAGGVPGTDEDPLDLDSRLQRNQTLRTQVDGWMRQVGGMSRKSPKAALAWSQLLNVKSALDAEGSSLQRRYGLAQKGQKQRDDAAAAASLLEQKRAVAGGLRESALARGIPMQEVNTRMEMWLRNPKADVNSLMDDYDKYVHEQAMAKQRATGNEFRERGMENTESHREWQRKQAEARLATIREAAQHRDANTRQKAQESLYREIRREWDDATDPLAPHAPNFTGFKPDELRAFIESQRPQRDLRTALEASMNDPGRGGAPAPAPAGPAPESAVSDPTRAAEDEWALVPDAEATEERRQEILRKHGLAPR